MFAIFKITFFFGIVAILNQQILATQVRMCVEERPAELKCLKMAEKVKDIAEVKCVLDELCHKVVKNDKADFTVIDADMHTSVLSDLEPILYEKFDDENVIVAVIDSDLEDKVHETPLKFKKTDLRELHSALYLNHYRHNGVCNDVEPKDNADTIKIVRYHDLKDKTNKKLVCVKNDKVVVEKIDNYKECHVEANIPNAVMVKKNSDKKDVIVKVLEEAAKNKDKDFKLFGEFDGNHNVLFSDETKTLVKEHPVSNGVTVEKFVKLHCGDVQH